MLLPREPGESVAAFIQKIQPIVYDMKVEPKLVDLRADIDNVASSSVNFYEGVTQKEVEAYYSKFDTKGNAPSWGLNSKLMKENGQIVEKVWKVGGMYGPAIERIVGWLAHFLRCQKKGTPTEMLFVRHIFGAMSLIGEVRIGADSKQRRAQI